MVVKRGFVLRLAAVGVCLHLGACGSMGSNSGVDDALELTTGMLNLGVAAAGLAGGGGGSYSAPRSTPSSGSTYRAPQTGNGYSQKGAFDDCARLYGSVGANQQAAECRRRSTNMGSLH